MVPKNPPPLCAERLARLIRTLRRRGGRETLRQLVRHYSFHPSELTQAEHLGWIRIETRHYLHRPGRPSRIACLEEKIDLDTIRVPLLLADIPQPIPEAHRRFAALTLAWVPHRGSFPFKFVSATRAYLATHPRVRSYAAARVGGCRLLRHPNVRAVLAWLQAQGNDEITEDEFCPATAAEIMEKLRHIRALARWQEQSEEK